MRDYVVDRVIRSAEYIVEHGATLRDTAAHFGIGKSTVHTDMRERLMLLDPILYGEVKRVLDLNLTERHLRGGESTRMGYLEHRILRKRH